MAGVDRAARRAVRATVGPVTSGAPFHGAPLHPIEVPASQCPQTAYRTSWSPSRNQGQRAGSRRVGESKEGARVESRGTRVALAGLPACPPAPARGTRVASAAKVTVLSALRGSRYPQPPDRRRRPATPGSLARAFTGRAGYFTITRGKSGSAFGMMTVGVWRISVSSPTRCAT